MSSLLRSSFGIALLITLAGPVNAADVPVDATMVVIEPDHTDANRVLPLEGALNVRDLGGIKGDDGAIPYSHFIRAANLSKLTPADRDVLYKRGVVLDIDLRTAGEEHASPDALASDAHIRYLPISLLGSQLPKASKLPTLREMYVGALADDQTQFKQVFEAIAAAGQGGVLYHCTAGKDRTGMISAMLLQLAGVPRDQIVHNYAVSAYYLKPMMTGAMAEMLKKQPAAAAMMDSPPEAIEGFLDTLNTQYGGAAAYLLTIGVSAADIAKIRDRLTP